MAQAADKQQGVLQSLDKWTIVIYLTLLVFGWISVCGASYTYGSTDIFSLDTRSGMQINSLRLHLVDDGRPYLQHVLLRDLRLPPHLAFCHNLQSS